MLQSPSRVQSRDAPAAESVYLWPELWAPVAPSKWPPAGLISVLLGTPRRPWVTMSGAGAGEREARSSRRPSPLRATVPVQVWTIGVYRASGPLRASHSMLIFLPVFLILIFIPWDTWVLQRTHLCHTDYLGLQVPFGSLQLTCHFFMGLWGPHGPSQCYVWYHRYGRVYALTKSENKILWLLG